MPTIEFTLAAVPIRLNSNSSELTDLLAAYFRYYQPRPSDEARAVQQSANPLNLTLDFCAALPARQTLLTPKATLFSHTGVIQLWRDDEVFFFEMDAAAFFVEPQLGRANGYLTRAALSHPRIVANTYTMLALMLLLRARNVYHLHAAAVLTPGGKLCVIPAAPRAGKTTLATALGLAGWQPVSDDSLLLEASARPNLTPLRKEFHLDEQLLVRWSGLARAEVRHRYLGRACVEALEYFGTVKLAERQYTQIDYVIVPQISGEQRSRLEPLSPSKALLRLAEQSMFLQLWRPHTTRQFDALAALIQSAKAHQLWCGKDVLEDPCAAAAVLQNLL